MTSKFIIDGKEHSRILKNSIDNDVYRRMLNTIIDLEENFKQESENNDKGTSNAKKEVISLVFLIPTFQSNSFLKNQVIMACNLRAKKT